MRGAFPFRSRNELLVFLLFLHLGFRQNLLLDVGGHDIVVTEFHRIAALPSGHAGEAAGIGGDFSQRCFGMDSLQSKVSYPGIREVQAVIEEI